MSRVLVFTVLQSTLQRRLKISLAGCGMRKIEQVIINYSGYCFDLWLFIVGVSLHVIPRIFVDEIPCDVVASVTTE